MSDILNKILAVKNSEIQQSRRRLSWADLEQQARMARPVRGFCQALQARVVERRSAVIAEIKKASPSKGILRSDFDPPSLARSYERGGAACLSVLTDKHFFQGDSEYLRAASEACALPILRKDFVIDVYQIVESRAMNADAILLIAAALSDAQMNELEAAAQDFSLDVLVEVHDGAELERALRLRTPLIGINNRNLRTFDTRLETTLELQKTMPIDRLVVSESGIAHHDDVSRLRDVGVYSYLVGEAFMRAPDPGLELQRLFPDAIPTGC